MARRRGRPPKGTRLDQLLVARGLAKDRSQAAAWVLAGSVRVDGGRVYRPDQRVAPQAQVELRQRRFVSRGGDKLDGALTALGLDVRGLTALDAGASTGGFTDCLLKRGAARVHAVDVGYGLLAWSLRSDPRVVVHERRHVKDLRLEDLGGPVDLVVADLSFISLARVLPALAALKTPAAPMLLLVKPQFEAQAHEVPAGGVIRDEALRQRVAEEVARAGAALGLRTLGQVDAALPGAAGNREIFLLLGPADGPLPPSLATGTEP